jgi:peptidylprolyl isomerase
MTRFAKTRSIPLAALLVLALLAAGCGSSTSESAADKSAAKAESEAKNQQPVPEAAAPTSLKAETLIAGNGAAIKTGQQATVNYVGVLFKTGKEFDTSWGKGKQPFQFALGSGQVIPGWDQGVVGMKVGERRRLTIPAALAYGAQGSPPKIGPNEPLIFDIDLKKIG